MAEFAASCGWADGHPGASCCCCWGAEPVTSCCCCGVLCLGRMRLSGGLLSSFPSLFTAGFAIPSGAV
eukprot:5201433-Amphidinium_carterae.1